MNVQAWNVLGSLLRRAGRFEEARRAYEAAIEADPFYPNAYCNLGILYDLYLQRPAEARRYYERYLVLAPAREKEIRRWLVDLERPRVAQVVVHRAMAVACGRGCDRPAAQRLAE